MNDPSPRPAVDTGSGAGPPAADVRARVARERQAHTEDDVLAASVRLKDRFHHIWTYPSRRRFDAVLRAHLTDLGGARVLDFGCGRGDLSLEILAGGGRVTGIDISTVYVGEAGRRCRAAGHGDDRFGFAVMDGHALAFADGAFDLVVGLGILHHLEPWSALREIHRVLRPGGRLLLQEPLADHPLLRLFRRLTPGARTADERPFSRVDLERIAGSSDWRSEMVFCGIVEAPLAVVTSLVAPGRPDNVVLRMADRLERRLHRAGLLPSWNQYVLINLLKREKDDAEGDGEPAGSHSAAPHRPGGPAPGSQASSRRRMGNPSRTG